MNRFNSLSTDTQNLLRQCGSKGLNVYALINRVEKELKRKIPEQVICGVCQSYLKKELKGQPWPWFKKALIAQYHLCLGIDLEKKWEKQKREWKREEMPKGVSDIVKSLCKTPSPVSSADKG